MKYDMTKIEELKSRFDGAKKLPISFYLGEEKILGIPDEFNPVMAAKTNGNVTDVAYEGKNADGLKIKTVVTTYSDYPVYEIVTYLTNESDKNSKMIRELQGFDGAFEGKEPYLYSNNGDYYSANGYTVTKEYFVNQMWTKFTPQTGRPCDQGFPYFKVQYEDYGLNIAIGWPAQWAADFSANLKGLSLKAGQEITNLYLCPGETIRTPKITIMAYAGDLDFGTNMWRMWYFDYILPRVNGAPLAPRMSISHNGGGEEHTKANEENQIEYIKKAAASPFPYKTWWIDAGWYECAFPNGEVHWYRTGNWFADPERFPNGLKPVSDELHKHGMELLLWFEPERVRKGTMIEKEHPEWLLNSEAEDDGEWGISRNFLLNLGNDDCREWLTDYIDGLIKDYGVTVYRQDFNFPPLRFWRENEALDRQGINENKYVQGYLKYWDELLRRNPDIWIDSCSSGGRRNDLETLRRSVPLHPTDYAYGYHPISQSFSRTLDTWIPYHRLIAGNWDKDGVYPDVNHIVWYPTDTFSRISSFTPFWSPSFPEKPTDEDIKLTKAWEEAMKIVLSGYFYPISKDSREPDNFFVNEYILPDGSKGYFRAVRNNRCEKSSYTASAKNVDVNCGYKLTNPLTGETVNMSGKDLAEKGFEIKLNQREAAIWFFEKV